MIKTLTLDRRKQGGILFLTYTSVTKDATGLGGTWQGSGNYADIHEVMGYFILMSFGLKPFAVYKSLKEMITDLETKLSLKVTVNYKNTGLPTIK